MEIIRLNLIPNGVNPTCHAKQYDEGRIIRFELFDGLTPYTLQSGDTVTLNVRKPDNTIIESSVTATQGNKYVDLVTTEQICAVAGYNLCTFKIANGSTEIGTLNFIMAVARDVLADGIPSQSVIEDLDALVQEAVGDNYYTKSETNELVDEKVAAMIDDTTTTDNKAWSSKKTSEEMLGILPTSTESGSVANFSTTIALPIDLSFEIKATQESGTPTPSSPKLISGYSSVVISHSGVDTSDPDIITIALGNTYYGGTLTQDKYGNRQAIITHGVLNLGDLSFTHHQNGFWYRQITDMKSCAVGDTPDLIAEKYVKATGQWIYGHGSNYGYAGQNGNMLYITDSTDPSGKLIYPLATPITIDLDNGDPITAFVGDNNIWCNCGNTSVIYKLGLADLLDVKADKSDTYTKTQVNEMIAKVDDQGIYVQSKLDSLSSPTTFAPKIDNKKNAVIEFIGYFSSFTSLTVGHGYGSISGSWVVVDDTNLTVYYSAPAQVKAQVAHGLTISDFIHVTVRQLNNAHADITITTASGDYTLTNAVWVGCQGMIYANVGSTINDVVINAVYRDFNEKLFLYGDSYVSLDDPARYPYYLIKNGYTRFLLDGWAGRASSDALLSFKNTVALVVPKYIIWAIGMNNADSGAVNPTWLADTQELLQICAAKGITPILTVTPNTPTHDNTYKNAWVKASGYRYIDFAKAVGAESSGSSWYTGMLYSDNVHPTALGAKALYARLITDAPEIMR